MGHGALGFGYGGGFFMPLMMIAIWAFLIFGAVYLIRLATGQGGTGAVKIGTDASPASPMEALQLRYAKGEVSAEEYEHIRKDIA